MGTLWIIGAGCSRNYTESTTPVRGLEPPLNKDFFVMARKVLLHYPNLIGAMTGGIAGLNHLIEDINLLFGYKRDEFETAVFDDKRLTLEGVMDHFYLRNRLLGYDVGYRLPEGESSRTRALGELLAVTIAESLQGPPCKKHASLAKLVKEGDVMISMNYDLLIDNALYNSGKLTDSGYNMRFDRALVEGKWTKPDDMQSKVYLLKLHGSLNWLRCSNCGFNLLLRGMKGVPLPSEYLRPDTVQCPRCHGVDIIGPTRMIIPPAATKDFRDPDIRYLWWSASNFCSQTTRIVSIGYRFSETDSELEMLLRETFGTSNIPLTIVNRHPKEVQKRYEGVFQNSQVHLHRTLAGFLNHGCGS